MTDAHCHICDLMKFSNTIERKIPCATSACNMEDFIFHEKIAQKPPEIFFCFAIHPQLPAVMKDYSPTLMENLEILVKEIRIHAVGEVGFDLYNEMFRETSTLQDEIFKHHLEIALENSLPMVIHTRKAMHKIFSYTKDLKKLPSVIFHSYPGTVNEGFSLLRRGINAYFSFGNTILLGRKETLRSCAILPLDRLLLETDAPYQNLRGTSFSHWGNLNEILKALFHLREDFCGEIKELEIILDDNFYRAYRSR